MKILLLGKENILNWLFHTQKALTSFENLEVKVVKTNHLGFFQDISRNILKPISKKISSKITSDYIASQISSFKPDFIIVISPFLLSHESLETLSASNATKVAWVGDKFGESHKKIATLFDLIYCTDTGFIEIAKEYSFPEAKYLPLAFNDDIFKVKKQLKDKNSLVFVGAYTRQRAELIKLLKYKNVEIYGPTWDKKSMPNINIYDKKIDMYRLVDLYNESKFVLNLKHEHNVINGLNMRTFESTSCGSCLLQDYVKDVELNFDIEKEIIVYRNFDELNDKVDLLQKDSRFYDSVVEAGYKRVCANHTYKHRMSTILRDIS